VLRVLVVSTLPLLGQGLEAWLRRQQGLHVVGYESDAEQVRARIEQLEPDVVIIDESTWLGSPATALMRFLASRPGARIIGVDLQDNSIRILNSEERAIDLVRQFLEAIKGQAVAEERVAQDGESGA